MKEANESGSFFFVCKTCFYVILFVCFYYDLVFFKSRLKVAIPL